MLRLRSQSCLPLLLAAMSSGIASSIHIADHSDGAGHGASSGQESIVGDADLDAFANEILREQTAADQAAKKTKLAEVEAEKASQNETVNNLDSARNAAGALLAVQAAEASRATSYTKVAAALQVKANGFRHRACSLGKAATQARKYVASAHKFAKFPHTIRNCVGKNTSITLKDPHWEATETTKVPGDQPSILEDSVGTAEEQTFQDSLAAVLESKPEAHTEARPIEKKTKKGVKKLKGGAKKKAKKTKRR